MLKTIELKNYRNLSTFIEFSKNNVLIAQNGSGKSNLLESIYYSNFTRSFKPIQSFNELIGPYELYAKVELEWDSGNLSCVITSSDAKTERRFEEFNSRKKMSEIIGQRNVLLFAPSTLNIVDGEPSIRRSDLDDFLSIMSKEYHANLEEYDKLLKNRNVVIKMLQENKAVEREFELFTEKLIDKAAAIHKFRTEFFTEIRPEVAKVAKQLYRGDDEIALAIEFIPNFKPTIDYKTELAEKFAANKQKEVVVGKTLYGPHKDDYTFLLDGDMLRYVGSRGQQRLAGLIFKIAQLNYIQQFNDNESIILLDDLMSELDVVHRDNCAEFLLHNDTQFILTSSVERDVPEFMQQASKNLSLVNED